MQWVVSPVDPTVRALCGSPRTVKWVPGQTLCHVKFSTCESVIPYVSG